MTDKLHYAGIYFLKDIACVGVSIVMDQGWLNVDILGFVDNQEIISWNVYLALLKSSHVRISNEADLLVWSQSKSGKYTPKAGYLHLIQDMNEVEISWWWKLLWKLKFPLKSKIFCWFFFQVNLLLGMSYIERVGRDVVDVIFTKWMLNLSFILGRTALSPEVYG